MDEAAQHPVGLPIDTAGAGVDCAQHPVGPVRGAAGAATVGAPDPVTVAGPSGVAAGPALPAGASPLLTFNPSPLAAFPGVEDTLKCPLRASDMLVYIPGPARASFELLGLKLMAKIVTILGDPRRASAHGAPGSSCLLLCSVVN